LGKLFIYKNPVKSMVVAIFNSPKVFLGKTEIPQNMNVGKYFSDLGKLVSILGE